jgi:hypothetical protein
MSAPSLPSKREPTLANAQISVDSFPNTHRFQSLRDDDLSQLQWLQTLRNGNTSSLVIPDKILPNIKTPPSLSSEADRDDGPPIDPLASKALFESKTQILYTSVPIVDVGAKASQVSTNEIAFPYTPKPFPICFLELTRVICSSRMSATMDIFIYLRGARGQSIDRPFTERARLDLSDPDHVIIGAYKQRNNTVMLPFPADPENALVVGILYMMGADELDLRNGRPTAIGFETILAERDSDILRMKWVVFEPGNSLAEHLTAEKPSARFDINLQVAIQTVCDPTRTCRLTADNPMFPSPLLTVSDIRLEKLQGFLPQKRANGNVMIYVGVSLRKSHPDLKASENKLLPAFISPSAMNLEDIGYTSSVPVGDKIAFVEPLHFVLDGSLTETITIQMNVFASQEQSKPKKILSFETPVTKVFEMHKVNIDAKRGSAARFNTLYPVVVAPPLALRKALDDPSAETPITDLMYPQLVPYIIGRRISMDQLGHGDFRKLFDLFIGADLSLQIWIEHYFTPEPEFATLFLNKVVENIVQIESLSSMPFFMLIVKAMRVNNSFDGAALDRLFTTVTQMKPAKAPPPESGREKSYSPKTQNIPGCLKSAADLLVQMGMSCAPKFVHVIAYRFLMQLGVVYRFFVFNYRGKKT